MQKIGALDGSPCVVSPSRLLHLSALANLTRSESRVRANTRRRRGNFKRMIAKENRKPCRGAGVCAYTQGGMRMLMWRHVHTNAFSKTGPDGKAHEERGIIVVLCALAYDQVRPENSEEQPT